jgi:hypothetical protein
MSQKIENENVRLGKDILCAGLLVEVYIVILVDGLRECW